MRSSSTSGCPRRTATRGSPSSSNPADGVQTGVLLLSMYASPTLALRALSAGGATGYLLKDRIRDGGALVDAVRTVSRGGTVVNPEVVAMMLRASSATSRLDALSTREREVLGLMAEGRSNTGIANQIHLAVKTVDSHVEHLLTKLAAGGARRRAPPGPSRTGIAAGARHLNGWA